MATKSDREPGFVERYPVEAVAVVLVVGLAVVLSIPRILGAGWAPQMADNFTTFQIIFSLLEFVGLSLVATTILVGLALGYVPDDQQGLTRTLGFSVIVVIAVAGVLLLGALLVNAAVPPLVRVGGLVVLIGLLGVGLVALPGWYSESSNTEKAGSDR